jgi:hypothetical protein
MSVVRENIKKYTERSTFQNMSPTAETHQGIRIDLLGLGFRV